MGQTRHLFTRDLLVAVGAPGTLENAVALIGQMQAEGGSARCNPLNCVVKRPGSTNYNSVPVQNYPSWAVGVEATASMLKQANMKMLLDVLRDGTSATSYWNALGKSPWGTHVPSGYTIAGWLDDVRKHWYARSMITIAGS